MKIIVLDIETTGFNSRFDAILEIGMALVDTDTKEIKQLFNEVVLDKRFNANKHKNSWIFQNSTLTVEDVINARPLYLVRPEIQQILNKYPVTAFNASFDFRFLEYVNLKINKVKCLMKTSRPYYYNMTGKNKNPSVQEMYDVLFPGEIYEEQHRGYDDATHEAKILLKLVELKSKQKEVILD